MYSNIMVFCNFVKLLKIWHKKFRMMIFDAVLTYKLKLWKAILFNPSFRRLIHTEKE
jgi:hypothetical protein